MNEEGNIISFKFQGTTFITFKNDSPYLQIVLICNTKSFSKSKLLELCNIMNNEKFVVKFILPEENVWCCYEFKPNEQTSSDEFELALMLLDKSSDELLEKLNQ